MSPASSYKFNLAGGTVASLRRSVVKNCASNLPGDGHPSTHLTVAFEMLADGDGLLDEEVQILGDVGGETLRLQDAQDLVAGNKADLSDTVRITEYHTCKTNTHNKKHDTVDKKVNKGS